MRHLILSIGLLSAFALPNITHANVATFDDLSLSNESAFVAGFDTSFSSGGITFQQDWNETYNCCASGWFYSNQTDITTAGFLNQHSAITAGGANNSENYAIANLGNADIEFSAPTQINSTYITNTTYAYLAIQNGDDGNNNPIVKGPFDETDFFTLTISGYDENSNFTNSVDVQLWDAVAKQALDDWLFVDLSSLGIVSKLGFSLASSDNGSFGMNTPAYFALDELSVTTVPVPAGVWLMFSALGSLFIRNRKNA